MGLGTYHSVLCTLYDVTLWSMSTLVILLLPILYQCLLKHLGMPPVSTRGPWHPVLGFQCGALVSYALTALYRQVKHCCNKCITYSQYKTVFLQYSNYFLSGNKWLQYLLQESVHFFSKAVHG